MNAFLAIVLYAVACFICGAIGKTVGADLAHGYTEDTSPNVEGVAAGTILAFLCFAVASCLVIWG